MNEPHRWECFNFPSQRWLSLMDEEHRVFHWLNPFPYPVSFMHSLHEAVKDMPDDCTVIYYDDDSFGVIREKETI